MARVENSRNGMSRKIGKIPIRCTKSSLRGGGKSTLAACAVRRSVTVVRGAAQAACIPTSLWPSSVAASYSVVALATCLLHMQFRHNISDFSAFQQTMLS
jgi:hypothetical protein